MTIWFEGLYLEEIKIQGYKYFAVLDNRKLLFYTTNKKAALNILNHYKEEQKKNDQPNS